MEFRSQFSTPPHPPVPSVGMCEGCGEPCFRRSISGVITGRAAVLRESFPLLSLLKDPCLSREIGGRVRVGKDPRMCLSKHLPRSRDGQGRVQRCPGHSPAYGVLELLAGVLELLAGPPTVSFEEVTGVAMGTGAESPGPSKD